MNFFSSLSVRARRSARPAKVLTGLGLVALLAACASTPLPPHVPPQAPQTLPSTPSSTPPLPSVSQAPRVLAPHAPLSEISIASATPPPVTMLAAPLDIWERIRRGLSMQDLDGELVRDREQWYASRPDYIQRMTERSSRYLFHIVEEIERRNLPMELALLPFIESAFNPQAVSSARAAGMWQFMPATGQSFDLKQNVFRDDRRDVLASTRAALDYLEQLHARFGDWHLALAAYNWGQGNVNRAITRNQREGRSTSYTDLNMPLETRMYVPKLQAVENIVARPEMFGTVLPSIGNHPFFDTLTIERDMDVSLIASLADISERDFRTLNPSIKQPLVMAAGTPNILLPWDNAKVFEEKLKSYRGPLASWTAWVAPTTMGLDQVARQVGMSESELREVNNIPPRMKVRAGSSLLVHRSGTRDRDVSEFVADNAQLSLAPEVVLKRTVVRARKGDTLARVAQRYRVSTVSVAGWNGLSVNAKLRSGQRLTLMLPKSVSVAERAPARSAKASKAARGQQASLKKPVRAVKAAKGKQRSVRVASEDRAGRKTAKR
ncbi:transglycosylase SLT domain-containing protein [Hydrogenophaga pseudoflava]|uniref:transglycosylase SLT domain-containing protein n=1 Tax=Hydrogenophaga pseudoflava TaxID=47421 RepID=UPI0027E51C0F|nr:transglycosylase SLT domain-containing protein [Hydrogenophaga pseudoflava]MDQ7744321.1 transglycosylase SLT domain-containing protein [Hydrogenophaga pseudoflava]